ncbi:MAG: acetyltransferase [Candidatus Thiodiazotropha sp.]
MEKLLIVGASGHGKVVADAAMASGVWKDIAFLDDRFEEMKSVLGKPVIDCVDEAEKYRQAYINAVVAIGDNQRRLVVQQMLEESGYELATIIHPTAVIGVDVEIGTGTVVFANAVINVGTRLGKSCIVNTSASIDHDCLLGNGVHISPGTSVAGGVVIGHRTWVGIGASVIQCCEIGEDVIIGAGAVVVNDIPQNTTAIGVPAKQKVLSND